MASVSDIPKISDARKSELVAGKQTILIWGRCKRYLKSLNTSPDELEELSSLCSR